MAKFYCNCSANCILTAADYLGDKPTNLKIVDPSKFGIGFVILGLAIKLTKAYPNQNFILAYVSQDMEVHSYGLNQLVIGSDQEFDTICLGKNLLYNKIILDSENKIWNRLWNN